MLTFMKKTLELARRAEREGEIPVGALLLDSDGGILAEAYNRPIGLNDPTAHAEILVLRQAAEHLGNYRLHGTTLYTTLEPCPMCAAAMVNARIDRLVFGAFDPRVGAAGSVLNLLDGSLLNHFVEVEGGICEEECRSLLQSFFRNRRLHEERYQSPVERARLEIG
ncbi:MAG: tRNA adenosine(34) deaminase TadA [Deltaproteobacteria bacterium]|nr:tRNA adenosine(34) deaminase TadA [Deltaproteobacteria bacterium]